MGFHYSDVTIVQKPWGRELIFAQTKDYVGKILEINPGHRLSLQYHQIKEETILVLEGECTIEGADGDHLVLYPLGAFHVTPGTVHRFCNYNSSVILKIAEVSTPHLADVVRLEDDYAR